MNDHIDHLRTWIGRSHTGTDVASASRLGRLAATLDLDFIPQVGDPLPPLWHFCLHPPSDRSDELGADGHPRRGGFLPPVDLPRRMWASGTVEFLGDVHVGEMVTKVSTVTDVTAKSGRSGPLCFVTLRHELLVNGETRLIETQDLVYRDLPAGGQNPSPKPAPATAQWARKITPGAVLLFRYSALTFNAHRIHYDRDYARSVEGYDDLVVHGPLTATLLAGLAVAESRRSLASFGFRAVSPLHDTEPFTIAGRAEGDGAELWASTAAGGLAMTAHARWR